VAPPLFPKGGEFGAELRGVTATVTAMVTAVHHPIFLEKEFLGS
jgi:hypothetical protein